MPKASWLRGGSPRALRLLVHRSGEHPTLPAAELEAVLAADGYAWRHDERHGRVDVGNTSRPDGRSFGPVELNASLSRLAMVHEVDLYRFDCARTPEALRTAARAHRLDGVRSFAVRADRTDPDAPRDGPLGRADVERILGDMFRGPPLVDLQRPERVLRAWLAADRVYVGDRLVEVDRGAFEQRTAKNRPYFSPVSGSPRWMRAIVNLARAPLGATVYDPLCGTGGVLIEAGLAGYRIVGSDIDPDMVNGTAENCLHFGVEPGALFASDVREAVAGYRAVTKRKHVDAIVTDLPYGQSASTAKAEPEDVARWTLDTASALLPKGGRAVVGAADPAWLAEPPAPMKVEAQFDLRQHRAMTRSYVVFRRV